MKPCAACDCADPTALPGLAAECECACHVRRSNPTRAPAADADTEGRVYRIIRFRFNGGKRTLRTGLTLSEAQAHCSNPETSSSTASPATLRRCPGRWFDGFDYVKGCRPK